MTQNDLKLVATDDLIEELFCRFDHAIFSGLKSDHPQGEIRKTHFTGNRILCCGLCSGLEHRLNTELDEDETEMENEDT